MVRVIVKGEIYVTERKKVWLRVSGSIDEGRVSYCVGCVPGQIIAGENVTCPLHRLWCMSARDLRG